MADSKELKARRRRIKCLHEMNQCVKHIYSKYTIMGNGTITGIPVKQKFLHGYYHTELLEKLPELQDCYFEASKIYDAWRDKNKPDEIVIEDTGELFLVDNEANTKILVGKKFPPMKDGNSVAMEPYRAYIEATRRVKEISDIVESTLTIMEFTDEQISDMIGYKKINPMFRDEKRYEMMLTISEFPLLKKFKHLKAYLMDYDPKYNIYFDVVFSTYNNSGERSLVKRRFLKMAD